MANSELVVSTTTGITPLSVTYTATSTVTNITQWALDYGDGVIETASDTYHIGWPPTVLELLNDFPHPHVYSTASTFTATLTLTNGGTQTVTASAVTVVAPTVTSTFVVSSTTSGLLTDGHVNVIAIMTDSSTTNDPSGLKSRLWTLSHTSGTVTSSDNPFVDWIGGTVTDAGWYSLTLTETSAQGSVGTSTNTRAFSVPYASVTATFSPYTSPIGYTPLTVTFLNNSKGDGKSAAWAFGDTGTSTSTSTYVTHTYTTAGQYDVTQVVTASVVSTNTTGVATTVTTVTRSDLVTVVDSGAFQNTVGNIFREVQAHLLCNPDQSPCDAFTEFGGIANLITIYYRRLREFLRETEILVTESTATNAATGLYTLPATCLRLLRVEVDGQNVNPVDRKVADLAFQGWETNTDTSQEVMAYIFEPEPSLTLQIVPTYATVTTVKVLYVGSPNEPSVPSDCVTWGALPLPYAIYWAVKWGMIADLLRQEGEMNDPVRAAFAEEIYQLGVQLTKILLYPGTRK